MKFGALIIIAIFFSSFSLSARTVKKTKSYTSTVEAETENLLKAAIKEELPLVKLGKKSDPFDCYAVKPIKVNILNISVNKMYSVDSEDNLTPYYVGKIKYTQKFKCYEGK